MKWINLSEKFKLLTSMLTSRLINGYGSHSQLRFNNILCIKDDEIGDMCYSLPVFQMLRNQFPDAAITVFCKNYCVPLLKPNPGITEIKTSWSELTGKYDLIVDLRISWKSIGFAFKKWPGVRLDRGTVRFADGLQKKNPHELITNSKVIEPVIDIKNRTMTPVLYASKEDRKNAEQYILKHHLQQFAMMHVTARRVLKEWPANNFCQLAEHLHKNKNMQIVFIGDASELKAIDQVRSRLSFDSISTAGQLSLSELAVVMESCTLYIGNDSGPLHIAAIKNIPTLGLFGPAPKEMFYPMGKQATYIHKILDCNPCDQVHCVLAQNRCMEQITVKEVIAKTEELLNRLQPVH
ncbi:MAG: glycosyltransferase family 9 protein [Bacteroidota bacterium]